MTPTLTAPAQTPAPARAGAKPERFLQEVRAALPIWVRALLVQAADGLESAQQSNAVASDRQHTLPALQALRGDLVGLVDRITRRLHQALSGAALAEAEATPNAALTLIDEAQIDADIEVGRLVQFIASTADPEMQRLAALCGGLYGLGHVDVARLPLPPLACAQGLREGLTDVSADLSSDPGTRQLLLRHLGLAAGQQLKAVYTAQADLLAAWGVQPAPYRLVLTASMDRPAAVPTPLPNDTPSASALPAATSALQRLVAHARDSLAQEDAAAPPDGALPVLRLMDSPRPVGSAVAGLDPSGAARLMERLFSHIENQLALSPHSRDLLSGLHEPGRVLVASEPQVWQNPDHPWWRLLDRLISLDPASEPGQAATHAPAGATDPVGNAMVQAVQSLARTPTASREAWQAASDQVQAAADRATQEQQAALQPQVDELQHQVDREELETELRRQLVQQLRSTPVCAGLRQFLLGPWAQALTQVALKHGSGTPAMNQQALVVDDLIQAMQRVGKPVSSAQRQVLLRQVHDGLEAAGLPPSRLTAELHDLQTLLRNPPPLQGDAPAQAQQAGAEFVAEPVAEHSPDSMTAPLTMDVHGALPTVPMALAGPGGEPGAAAAPEWATTLALGDLCRVFLLGRWMTVKVAWMSEARNLFLFSSRHAGRTHSMTRRMLQKLREAGLATRIEDGALLAQAMDSLVDTDFASV